MPDSSAGAYSSVARGISAGLVLMSVCSITPVVARTWQQRGIFRTGTELVQVDVVVLDEAGRPVKGLSPSDITLLDAKRPRNIEIFREVTRARGEATDRPSPPDKVMADVADNSTAKSERVVILVIHDLGLWKARVDLVKDLARQVVDDLGRQASMAVLFSSGRGGVEVTEDRAVLFGAIDTLEGQFYEGRRGSSDLRKTVQDVANFLRDDSARRKAVIVITEGIGGDVRGLFDTMQARPHSNPIANPKYVAWNDYELLDMMEALRRANATLYLVDPRGRLRTAGERASESRTESGGLAMFDPLIVSQESLKLTAEAAGGFAVVETNDFRDGLSRIIADLDNYYVLGFYPEAPDDRKWHTLEVTVNRPGVIARHRKGYRLGTTSANSKNQEPLVALSAGVVPQTGLPLRLFATPIAVSGRTPRVAVALEVRARHTDVVLPDGSVRDSLRATILAVDLKKKKITRRVNRTAEITIPRARVSLSGDVLYSLVMAIDLLPGSYQLRVSAISERLGKSGSVYLAMTVPEVPRAGVLIAGPVLALGGSPSARPMPTTASGLLPIRPAFDRVFSRDQTVRVVYWLAHKGSSGTAPSRVEIVNAEGEVVFGADAHVGVFTEGMADLNIPLSAFAPGSYRLRVRAGEGSDIAIREVGFAISSGSDNPLARGMLPLMDEKNHPSGATVLPVCCTGEVTIP
jgi:VWFA-related protein